jgi:hypothetical protein
LQAIYRPTIRQRESGNTFTRRDTPVAQILCINPNGERSRCVTLHLVVQKDRTRIVRHQLSNFIHQHRQRFLDLEDELNLRAIS